MPSLTGWRRIWRARVWARIALPAVLAALLVGAVWLAIEASAAQPTSAVDADRSSAAADGPAGVGAADGNDPDADERADSRSSRVGASSQEALPAGADAEVSTAPSTADSSPASAQAGAERQVSSGGATAPVTTSPPASATDGDRPDPADPDSAGADPDLVTDDATGDDSEDPSPATTASSSPTTEQEPPATTVAGNQAPVVEQPDDRSTPEGEGVILAVRASDPDGDPLLLLASNLPPGLAIDDRSGVITGTPSAGGTWEVTVNVTDPGGAAASVTFTWAVTTRPVAENCSLEGQVRSRQSVAELSFELTNGSDAAIDVHWLNHSGNRVHTHTIAAGETTEIQSFRTHPWLVADPGTGRCLEVLMNPADGDRITHR